VVKDLALSRLLRFNPWPGNFCMLLVPPKKKKEKKRKERKKDVIRFLEVVVSNCGEGIYF